MLCISAQDIENAVSLTEIVDTIETAFLIYEEGSFYMPERMHINHSENTLLLMPCFTNNKFATKLVSLFPENYKRNKPVLYGSVILNNGKTGEPLAILNGAKLTAMRTGAVGGTAIRHLADKSVGSLGIIGAGVQGFHQALFGFNERNIKIINVFDPYSSVTNNFIDKFSQLNIDVEIKLKKSAEQVLDNSDVLIMSTNSNQPVLPDISCKLKDKTYVAIGSYKPEMNEIPLSLFSLANQYFIDTEHAFTESGDLINPLNNKWFDKTNVHTMGKLLTGKIKLSSNKTRIFKSVGMALFDLVCADLIYKKALEKGIGTNVKL